MEELTCTVRDVAIDPASSRCPCKGGITPPSKEGSLHLGLDLLHPVVLRGVPAARLNAGTVSNELLKSPGGAGLGRGAMCKRLAGVRQVVGLGRARVGGNAQLRAVDA